MSPLEHERLNRLRATAESFADDEMRQFEACPTCGQTIDLRRLGDVLYHDEPDHAPLPVN